MIDIKNNKINNKHSYLLEYYNKIKSGEIIAGHEIIQQLENLVEDLDNPAYIYNTRDAEFRMDFIENFCRHTKSPFYGMPFKLLLWEKAVIESFYSFKWTDEGYRNYYGEEPPKKNLQRFKKLILLVARKNGKSTLCSALVLTELLCGNGGSEIVVSSNDDRQASIVFEETNVMREIFDPQEKRTHKNLKYIMNTINNSKVFKMSDRTQNKEGSNIDGAILDESHEMKKNVIAKSIEQSQSVKDEPWLINITTEGFIIDGYLDKELKYGRKVLARDIEDATLLCFFYTQDSEKEIWQDEKSWGKSNPSLGEVKKVRYIKDQIRKSQHEKAERIFMLAKDFNIKQNGAESWLTIEDIKNEETFDLEQFRNSFAIGGVDLSRTGDLANARALFIDTETGKKYTKTQYFMPKSKLENILDEDKPKFEEWIEQELITISPGNENDFRLVTQWYVDLYKDYGIKFFKIGYDKWSAIYWKNEMEEYGFDCERVTQDYGTMSGPMKLVEADLKSKLINYNNNPIDEYCLLNTAIKINNKMDMMPAKIENQPEKKIDGAVTMIIAYKVYIDNRTEFLELSGR